MTPRDHATFNAGVRHAGYMALIAALALEVRSDAADMRQRAAIEALRGLSDGLRSYSGDEATDVPIAALAGRTRQGIAFAPPIASRDQAVAVGYTGDACGSCGSFAMKRAGACLSCDACGGSSGCS